MTSEQRLISELESNALLQRRQKQQKWSKYWSSNNISSIESNYDEMVGTQRDKINEYD